MDRRGRMVEKDRRIWRVLRVHVTEICKIRRGSWHHQVWMDRKDRRGERGYQNFWVQKVWKVHMG